ncbi:unnamed protein product [Coccothraustes coccothraustes]
MLPEEDEALHALITANTMENVKKAVEQIRNIPKQGIEILKDHINLCKMQLRELARLNGTLWDDNRILRPWRSTEPCSITNSTVCTKCGGAGHVASDCRFVRPGDPQLAQDKAWMDKEYLSLMAELGEARASLSSNAAHNNSPLSSSHCAPSQAGDGPLWAAPLDELSTLRELPLPWAIQGARGTWGSPQLPPPQSRQNVWAFV